MTSDNLFDSIMPAVPPRVLLGPGPSSASPRVLQAMMAPMIGYLDPDFISIVSEVSELLRILFHAKSGQTLALSGTGSAGMEAGLTSLLEPGDVAVICVCGFFGERMVEMASRVDAEVVALRSEWGKPFPVDKLEAELQTRSKVKLVAVVHAETSTGVMQPLDELSRLAKEHDSLFMVDAVTSLAGIEIAVDKLGIDYCYSATQKCLGCPPGLSPVAISDKALQAVKCRKRKPMSWYLDLELIANYWGEDHIYHHTAPVSMIFALREGLRMVLEEGLEERYQRHYRNAAALRDGLQALGLDLVVPEPYRLPQITPIWVPEGVDDMELRQTLLRDYKIEIGRGLGEFSGKVWRVGLMGESSKPEYVLGLLAALEDVLSRSQFEVAYGAGVSAASRSLSAN